MVSWLASQGVRSVVAVSRHGRLGGLEAALMSGTAVTQLELTIVQVSRATAAAAVAHGVFGCLNYLQTSQDSTHPLV
jgi:hypothetical protein